MSTSGNIALAYVLTPTAEEVLRLGDVHPSKRSDYPILAAATELSGLDFAHQDFVSATTTSPVEVDQRDLYITHSSPTRNSRRILEEKSQITRSPEVIDKIEELYGPIQEEGLKDFCKKYQEAWQTFHSTGHRVYNVDFPSIRAMRLSAQIQTYDLLEDQRKSKGDELPIASFL